MNEHEQKILELKVGGKSLREIASILGISHEAVRKRVKGLQSEDRLSIKAREQGLTPSTKEKEKVSTVSNARKSKVCGESNQSVNQLSTKKTPSLPLNQAVTRFKNAKKQAHRGQKVVSPAVFSEVDGLIGAIKGFLEGLGIEIYRMESEMEAYQVKSNGQVIRFYVQRKGTK